MPITGVKGLAIIRYIRPVSLKRGCVRGWYLFDHHATLGHEPDNPFRRLPARSTLGNSKREQKSDPL
ncbi:unnamed protein product [Linum trigynum]|uniref:Uncharacterized protein n=1 Tax=Linum trigynum TaxID=586398 RepID=A0AAV2CAL9_9ROSI